MKSGGNNVDVMNAAAAMFKKIKGITELPHIEDVAEMLRSASLAVSGYVHNDHAIFKGITTFGGTMKASLFGNRAIGDSPRVLAMAAALEEPTDMACALLAKCIKEIRNS